MAKGDKRDWFATGESDEEDAGYDSERAEASKGKTSTFSLHKRRKLSTNVDVHSDNDRSDDGSAESSFVTAEESQDEEDTAAGNRGVAITDAHTGNDDQEKSISTTGAARQTPSKAARKLAKHHAKGKKTGVLYMSRIPPFMKPHTLRNLLAPHAPSGLNRIFLTPENTETHKARVKSGGNKKKSFLDGWVEFVSKKEAKLAAETLNGKNIGGKKGNYYYDDAWNLRYLHGYKWRHLTEQIANENAEKDARLRAEAARERKEANNFVRNIDQAKILDGIARKAKRHVEDTVAVTGSADNDLGRVNNARSKPERAPNRSVTFRQSKVLSNDKERGQSGKPSLDTQRVLSKIF